MRLRAFCKPAFIIALSILIFSCNQQNTEWQGTIEVVDGVTIVMNPIEPLYGEGALELKEDLSIGEAEGREEYMFGLIGIDVDDLGNLYVIDSKMMKFRVFDENGNHRYSFGEQGQGPGEMQRPSVSSIQITPNNEIMIKDPLSTRAIFYSLKGDYLRQLLYPSPVGAAGLRLTAWSIYIANIRHPPVSEIQQDLRLYDSDFNHISTIKELRIDKPYNANFAQVLRPQLHYCLSPEDTFYWGSSENYVLYECDSQMRVIREIRKEYRPMEIYERDIEREKRVYKRLSKSVGREIKVDLPRHYPAFSEFYSDDEGRLYVRTHEYDERNPDNNIFDIFDSNGRYITRASIRTKNTRQFLWKNESLYTVERDEQGYLYIKRYRVTWNY